MPSANITASAFHRVGQEFVRYYKSLSYQELPGSSLLTDSLPMTFVMSAGMVQFELLAEQQREADHFVLIQRCFRHFDINRVGESDTHLSLFHMPGAFVFGKINREEVVSRLWHLLVDVYGFSPASLAVTYFQGGRVNNTFVPEDKDTKRAWINAGMPVERIFGLPAESNFWTQSPHMVGIVNSRKCGPNTEVFYDRGEHLACGPDCKPGCTCGRYVEFSNTLLIEYSFGENDSLYPLEEPFTEVVVGQERVAMLLGNRASVYDIETLYPLVRQVKCFSEPGMLSTEEVTHYERIVADHLRALLYLTLDGAPPPGRGGRARLMRILVRELLTAKEMLGITDPAFFRSMFYVTKDIYPETRRIWEKVDGYIRQEAIRFHETIARGMRYLDKQIESGKKVTGADLFAYEKQHGLPFVFLTYHLQQKGYRLDVQEYTAYKQAKSEFARAQQSAG